MREQFSHGAYYHALRQFRSALWHPLTSHLQPLTSIEHIVHHKVEARREIGHIAAEGLIGVNGNLQAVEVQPVVGCEELLQVGIFIAFHLL